MCSDVSNTDNLGLAYQHVEPTNIRLEDNYRRRHYERQICKIRNELLEEQQQNRGLKVCVDDEKNQSPQLQDSWCHFSPSKELEKLNDSLAIKLEDGRNVTERAQSVMSFQYECIESPEWSEQECRKLYPAERENVFHYECIKDSKYKHNESKLKRYDIGTNQLTNKTARNYRTEDDKTSKFLCLLNEFGGVHEAFQSLKTNLTQLKDERQILDLKLMELSRGIRILEEQKIVLEKTLVEHKEKEMIIQKEIKQLSYHMEQLKHAFNQLKSSEGVCGVTSKSSLSVVETAMENGQIKHFQHSEEKNNIPKQFALELKLLQDIHKEELQLYRLQLAQAAQQIKDLEVQLHHKTKREVIKKQYGSKHKTRNCNIRENNLVNDGTVYKQEVKLLAIDEYRKIHEKGETTFVNENIPCENHISSDVIENRFQLESTLRSLMLDRIDTFKQEILNIIREEVKQNILSVYGRLTALENNIQKVVSVVKTDDASNGGDETCVDYMEDSTLCKKRNTLDCGTAMAFNFYYGYLKLILPVGISSQGIKRRILKYIENERLSENAFPMKKLIILIPENTYIPTNLKELSVDDPNEGNKYWIECVKPLQPEIIERNGWKRDFHHPVYRVKDPNSESGSANYVVAEFATPVKMFNDIIHKCPVPKISEAIKISQQKIISSFHKSLLERIRKNDDGCKDLCEIIYYPDTDKNEKRVNIGRIILDRIHSMNASRYQ